jgi:hypothetical protein
MIYGLWGLNSKPRAVEVRKNCQLGTFPFVADLVRGEELDGGRGFESHQRLIIFLDLKKLGIGFWGLGIFFGVRNCQKECRIKGIKEDIRGLRFKIRGLGCEMDRK